MKIRINGRRGAFLLLFGIAFMLLGLSFITSPPDALIRQTMRWMPDWSPIWFCGLLWLGAGLFGVVFAFTRIPTDRFGFMAMSAVCVGWAVAHCIAQAVGTNDRAWVSAVIFSIMGGAILVVSGMPNPVHRGRP
jgi:hypothetical protein